MKHIIRLVTYAKLKPVVRAGLKVSRRVPAPIEDRVIETDTNRMPFPAVTPMLWMLTDDRGEYRMVGQARYPDRVESRYERYL